MDKLKELLQDKNNQIIAVAAGVVLVVAIVVAIVLITGKSGSDSAEGGQMAGPALITGAPIDPATGASAASTPGMPSMPSMPGSPSTPGMPSMPGSPSMPGMPSTPMSPSTPSVTGPTTPAAPSAAPAPAATSGSAEVKTASLSVPMEPGKADPFAPAGASTIDRTKTMGNKIRLRFVPSYPQNLYSVAFTEVDYGSLGKVLRAKTAKELEADKRAKEGEIPKPTNIRLSGIMTMSGSVKVAMFEILDGSGDNLESVRVGEKLTIGYDMSGDKVTATVKEINADEEYAILEPDQGKIVKWKYSVTAGNQTSPYGTGYGTGTMGSMGTMGGMSTMPSMPTMGGMSTMPSMPTMGGMSGGMGVTPDPGMGSMGGPSMPTLPGMGGMY